ncbi:YfiT family bacillithiol transferase [Robiginitalea aurantiaca]|uniref:Metal-dependent hydrolase n=1 Tax=Robiginitalea aurantiaca TaxID=3056915 RepID=A0ABT7WD37_9FLAO|nr:putative metal-dependent hydrolase [Robiginitalea aurantiaca]MDM9630830.1 putative metal-dependent hydrolase [Robiginitalea aurantiaca]
MEDREVDILRYPIGLYVAPDPITDDVLMDWIDALAGFPDRLSALVTPLTEEQLNTPYRDGGWTVRQVVHHLSDSHHNSYIRFKWALTEESPLIKVYDEKGWAALEDAASGPISLSLDHLKAVHQKLVYLLKHLDRAELKRGFVHPESGFTSLEENVGRYVWHGNHHFAHIDRLLQSRGWQG